MSKIKYEYLETTSLGFSRTTYDSNTVAIIHCTEEEILFSYEDRKNSYVFIYKSPLINTGYTLKIKETFPHDLIGNSMLFKSQKQCLEFLVLFSRFIPKENTIILDPNFTFKSNENLFNARIIQGFDKCLAAVSFLEGEEREMTIVAEDLPLECWNKLENKSNLTTLFLTKEDIKKAVEIEEISTKKEDLRFGKYLDYLTVNKDISIHFLSHLDESFSENRIDMFLQDLNREDKALIITNALLYKVPDNKIKYLLNKELPLIDNYYEFYPEYNSDCYLYHYLQFFKFDYKKTRNEIYYDTEKLFRLGYAPKKQEWIDLYSTFLNYLNIHYEYFTAEWIEKYLKLLLSHTPEEIFYTEFYDERKTLLMVAASKLYYFPSAFKMILEKSDNIFAQDANNQTVMEYASKGIQDILKTYHPLLSLHIKEDDSDEVFDISKIPAEYTPQEGATFIFKALDYLSAEEIINNFQSLIELIKKSDLSLRNEEGETILMRVFSAWDYYPDLYDVFIKGGADIYQTTEDGSHYLFEHIMLADTYKIEEKLTYLLKQGYKFKQNKNYHDFNPFHHAAMFFANEAGWNALRKYPDKSAVLQRDDRGYTPLIWAVKERNLLAIKNLVAMGGYIESDRTAIKTSLEKIDKTIAKERIIKRLPLCLVK